jgi:hypothetical protein
MATDKRVAKQKLGEMLIHLHGHRNDLAACSDKHDAFGVKRCVRLLKIDHSRIREHCAEHDLELPRDMPSEGAG